MAIIFYLQSKKNPAPIYVRIRQGRTVDAKAKTNFSIDPSLWHGGKIKKVKEPAGADADVKKSVNDKNKALILLEKKLADLANHITHLLNDKA